MFISSAFAQAAEGASSTGSMSGMIIQLVLIFAIFYIFLIRPQQKRIKEHEAKVNALKTGDKVITGGGIIAKVVEVNVADDELTLEIAQGVNVRVARPTVREVLSDEVTPVAAKKVKNKTK